MSAPGGLLWGVSALGGCLLQREGVPARGVPGGDPPDRYCCGRYASYWNAFLFCDNFMRTSESFVIFGFKEITTRSRPS